MENKRNHKFLIICLAILVVGQLITISPRLDCDSYSLFSCEVGVGIKLRGSGPKADTSPKIKKSGVATTFWLELISIVTLTGTLFYATYVAITTRQEILFDPQTGDCFLRRGKKLEKINCPEGLNIKEVKSEKF